MLSPVEVVVPWRGGYSHREAAWNWIRPRYEWKVTEAEPPLGPWVKANAVTPALQRSKAEVVVVADADVWADGLPAAVEAVKDGATWAMPHRGIFRLSEEATQQVLDGGDLESAAVEQPGYLGVFGGGVVVARRETLLDIPLDPRFVGWGQEDHAWGLALCTLIGKPWQAKMPLYHLWHPPQERLSRKWGSLEGKALWLRYVTAARSGPERMKELLKEIHESDLADQPNLHDHQAQPVR